MAAAMLAAHFAVQAAATDLHSLACQVAHMLVVAAAAVEPALLCAV